MRTCLRCPASLEGRYSTTKWCFDCSVIVRQERKVAWRARVREAYEKSAPAANASKTPKFCQFPGCHADLSGKPGNTVWCPDCRLKMDKSRAMRRYGKEGRQAVDPFQRRVAHVVSSDGPPRPPNVLKCRECCDMPWARTSERSNTKSGDNMGRNPVARFGMCLGCGEPWGPEPPVALGSALRSNMGPTIAYGRVHGGERLGTVGFRKGAKGT